MLAHDGEVKDRRLNPCLVILPSLCRLLDEIWDAMLRFLNLRRVLGLVLDGIMYRRSLVLMLFLRTRCARRVGRK